MANVPVLDDEDVVLKVASSSDPKKVSSAILNSIFSGVYPSVRAIGHGAIGQSSKALAIARGAAAAQGINLAVQIGFTTILNESGDEVSAIVFQTFNRR